MSDHDNEPDEEKGVDYGNAALILAGIAAGIGIAAAGKKAMDRWGRGKKRGSQMAEAVIAAARHLATPNPPLNYVGPGDDRWDEIVCGGLLRPGQWQWYEDGHGTSCAVFATAVLAQAGVDVWTSPITGSHGCLLLNYPPPRGVGFIPGGWQKRFMEGGKKLGIFTEDPDLQDGDLYCVMRENNPAKWHVGIIVARNGAELLDASGGQLGPPSPTAPKGVQCARLVKRTLRGRTMTGGAGGPAQVMWRLTWR